MTNTKRYDNLTSDLTQIASNTQNKNPFRSEAEFENWLALQLDELERLYADFETKDSLRSFFSR